MTPLLYLVHRMPYPPDKGDKVRSYHLLRHLQQRHRVFLGTFIDDPADEQHLDALRALCPDLHVARLNPRLARLHKAFRHRSGFADHQAVTPCQFTDCIGHRGVLPGVLDCNPVTITQVHRLEPAVETLLFGDRQASAAGGHIEHHVGAFDDRLLDAVERGVLGHPAATGKAEAQRQLERIGMGAYLHEQAGNLAMGPQRLMEIARALCADPALLLLDEPAAGLRHKEKQALADVLERTLAKSPGDRYQSGAELAAQLRRCVDSGDDAPMPEAVLPAAESTFEATHAFPRASENAMAATLVTPPPASSRGS